MWVYIQTESFTDEEGTLFLNFSVGFYNPSGAFVSDSDHGDRSSAREQVNYLNGGLGALARPTILHEIAKWEDDDEG
jgi:hypothetical protein